jgi:hypothetical protein
LYQFGVDSRDQICEPTGGTEDLNTFSGEASNVTNDAAFDLKDLLGLNSHVIKRMCVFFLYGI